MLLTRENLDRMQNSVLECEHQEKHQHLPDRSSRNTPCVDACAMNYNLFCENRNASQTSLQPETQIQFIGINGSSTHLLVDKHRNIVHSRSLLGFRKLRWRAQQGKEKSGAARKRGAYIFFCAAARRQPQKERQQMQERPQMLENREFHKLAKTPLSFGTDALPINFDHWDHFWAALKSYWNVEICCGNIPEISKSLEHKCWSMSRKLGKLWILPEGPPGRERWRRVLRTNLMIPRPCQNLLFHCNCTHRCEALSL